MGWSITRISQEDNQERSAETVKKRKKSLKTKLKIKAITLAKLRAKERDGYICQKCDKEVSGRNCHGSHVIPVSQDGRLACDILNIKAMCTHCHMFWWHKDPLAAQPWFKSKFPDRWEYLQAQRIQNLSLGAIQISFYEQILEELG
jgi:5-methylcytosine-specific restriction endonuclease McrA